MASESRRETNLLVRDNNFHCTALLSQDKRLHTVEGHAVDAVAVDFAHAVAHMQPPTLHGGRVGQDLRDIESFISIGFQGKPNAALAVFGGKFRGDAAFHG